MDDLKRRKPGSRRENQHRLSSWCCSLTVPPTSPENVAVHRSKTVRNKSGRSDIISKSTNSVTSSPLSSKSGFGLVGRMDRRFSPGRVSPIDPDYPTVHSMQEIGSDPSGVSRPMSRSRSESFRAPAEKFGALPDVLSRSSSSFGGSGREVFDVRLKLKGKSGGCLILEMNSGILSANSEVFAGLIAEHKKGSTAIDCSSGFKICRIEVPNVENLVVFKQTIELMFEDDITKRLLKLGVYRAIDILEVSAGIMFNKGVASCLKYLEAVPWTEEEEEKLRKLFTKLKVEEATTRDILARLYLLDSVQSTQDNLTRQLVWSIVACTDANARNDLKSLVKGLLCKSSVYEKDLGDFNIADLYLVCESCLGSLRRLFEEASDVVPQETPSNESGKTLIERISRHVDNINWLLEILLDLQMAEEFVDLWADQGELLRMHKSASPMVRYELSRISAMLFIAMGTRKLQCRTESRSGVVQAWFGPMLLDFGWLRRCKKGLDMSGLEEAMGQTLLTLPLKQQSVLFMEWFNYFSKHGSECPNLRKSIKCWWRRSENHSIEFSQNTLNLKASAESLVEEKPGLELRDEREPGQYCYGSKNDEPHHVLIPSC